VNFFGRRPLVTLIMMFLDYTGGWVSFREAEAGVSRVSGCTIPSCGQLTLGMVLFFGGSRWALGGQPAREAHASRRNWARSRDPIRDRTAAAEHGEEELRIAEGSPVAWTWAPAAAVHDPARHQVGPKRPGLRDGLSSRR